ncbi:GNAT family N-acetyltransferase [Rhizorhabdus sp.]|jgi:GNAT superfamily N-acetyltransferase|uniref:GNAT family N-acetyltransferase n=1 Tax=Rhizorhabdus sp. TaxID=1968843 RepID=UPI001B6BEE68|nr:GNAT family N-acetyltransferase [Rhizorhabdus sp.]MBP8232593.1 GNAT family N-acetyltransferase [Rhizorhabdus sp.]
MARRDLDSVVRIADHVHVDYPERPEIIAEKFALYPIGCMMLDGPDQAAGYVLAHPWHRTTPPKLDHPLGAIPENADTYYLHDLALLPEARGIGAGRAAVEMIVAQAKRTAFADISLIAVGNSVSFWNAQGFRAATDGPDRPYGPASLFMRRLLD